MLIRPETTSDERPIERVLLAAFPGPGEAELVTMLRRNGRLSYAWVAERDDRVAGFLGFSPITIDGMSCNGLGLAPLAVAPDSQRQGIGKRLTEHALAELRRTSVGLLVVLGDPAYYAAFGFRAASRWNLADEYGGGEAFQALELRPDSVPSGGGRVRYAPEFAQLGE